VLSGHSLPPQFGPASAAERARANLQNRYGERAANSIQAIQAAGANQGQGPRLGGPAIPAQGQPMTQQQYRQNIAASTQQQQQRAQAAQNGQQAFKASQVDGAEDEDFEGVLMHRDQAGNMVEMGRVEIDRMIHSQIAANAKAMEGGGLMLPLKEATKHTTATKTGRKSKAAGAGYDGPLDDDEDDEDAINSDLDDPDDDRDEDDEEDDALQHIMLCMYDKVQRVKNKWYDLPDVRYPRRQLLILQQEVRSQGRRSDRQWQGIRLPQGDGRVRVVRLACPASSTKPSYLRRYSLWTDSLGDIILRHPSYCVHGLAIGLHPPSYSLLGLIEITTISLGRSGIEKIPKKIQKIASLVLDMAPERMVLWFRKGLGMLDAAIELAVKALLFSLVFFGHHGTGSPACKAPAVLRRCGQPFSGGMLTVSPQGLEPVIAQFSRGLEA
jgi:hypothetical protein